MKEDIKVNRSNHGKERKRNREKRQRERGRKEWRQTEDEAETWKEVKRE